MFCPTPIHTQSPLFTLICQVPLLSLFSSPSACHPSRLPPTPHRYPTTSPSPVRPPSTIPSPFVLPAGVAVVPQPVPSPPDRGGSWRPAQPKPSRPFYFMYSCGGQLGPPDRRPAADVPCVGPSCMSRHLSLPSSFRCHPPPPEYLCTDHHRLNDRTHVLFFYYFSGGLPTTTGLMPDRRPAGHWRTSGGTVPHLERGRPLRGPAPLRMGPGGAGARRE